MLCNVIKRGAFILVNYCGNDFKEINPGCTMMIIQYISCFYSNKTWYKYAICFRCAKQTIYTEKYVEEKKSNNNNAIIIRITI